MPIYLLLLVVVLVTHGARASSDCLVLKAAKSKHLTPADDATSAAAAAAGVAAAAHFEVRPDAVQQAGGGTVPHLHLVDHNAASGNFLFRSGVVVQNAQFQYQSLVQQMAVEVTAKGFAFPHSFDLIDIDLTNFDQYGHDIDASTVEFDFFNANASAGSFKWWLTRGASANYTSLVASNPPLALFQVQTFPAWFGDQTVARSAALRQLVTTKQQRPQIILFHCDCGCDRTGEMAGAYYMRYMNFTWAQTNKQNTMIAGRPMDCDTYLGMQWMCLWLEKTVGGVFSNLNCATNHPCT